MSTKQLGRIAFCVVVTTALARVASATPACDFYAAPDGVATAPGTSETAPFTIRAFTTDTGSGMPAAPGKTLCLLDGEYHGAEQTISLHDLHGTEAEPITIRALHDGGVTISGDEQRAPLEIVGSSYIVVEGIDATHGACGTVNVSAVQLMEDHVNGLVVRTDPSHHVTLRRVTAANTNPGWEDGDADGVQDSVDSCDGTYNPPLSIAGGPLEQIDGDGDGIGNACDCDFDNSPSGVCDWVDAIIYLNDFCHYHPDYDDGVIDCEGPHPLTGHPTDMNGDGTVDQADLTLWNTAAADTEPGPIGNTAGTHNCMVLNIAGSDDLLLEDVAAFGTGRKMVQIYRSNRVTLRRAWARWEGNGGRNSQVVSCGYSSFGSRCENVLATHDPIQTPLGPNNGGGRAYIGVDGWSNIDWSYAPQDPPINGDPFYTGLLVTGSLAYQKDPAQCGSDFEGSQSCPGNGFWFANGKGATFRDSVVFVNEEPGTAGPDRYALGNYCLPAPVPWNGCVRGVGEPIDLSLVNITSWGATTKEAAGDWVQERIVGNPSISPVPAFSSVFTADPVTGQGGQLCRRANEANVPLWPWPMRDRILAATAQETPYSAPPTLEIAGWQPTAVDIHADIEQMFGAIPPQCWDGDGDTVADTEDNCHVEPNPSQANGDGDAFGDACDCDFDNDAATSCDWVDGIILLNDFCYYHPTYADQYIDCTLGPHPLSGHATDMDGNGIVDEIDGQIFGTQAEDDVPGPGAVPVP